MDLTPVGVIRSRPYELRFVRKQHRNRTETAWNRRTAGVRACAALFAGETGLYFGNFISDGGLGKFDDNRESAAIDKQSVFRLNRDMLYSFAVFDLDDGRDALPTASAR